ncbi:MAG TPA: hypothetical protein VHZ07_01255 [Bryobacteraceae bacterium]|nr:hypothetical protein [Bryobacteraceae bacterium]
MPLARPRSPGDWCSLCAYALLTVDLIEEEFEVIEAQLTKIKNQGNRTDEDLAKLRERACGSRVLGLFRSP